MDLEEGRDFRIARELVVTDKIMNDGFWIGVYPGMAVQAVQYMIDTIRTFVETANL
jgi:CDP-6-deoxy-D-xylo-4-hexulose-3-dehydrase